MTASPNGFQNPHQPESQIASLHYLQEYGRDITSTVSATHDTAIGIVETAEGSDTLSYQDKAKAAMEMIITQYNAADDATAEALRKAYFPLLLGYFLDRERDVPGPDTFTIKDFHFMDSRAKGNLHREFLAYGATILPPDQDDRHYVDLAMKCRELLLNGARRRAQDEGKTEEFSGIAESVEDLLEHWETLIDDPHYAAYAADSMARLETELGFMTRKLGDLARAANHYQKAGEHAERAGDEHNAIFNQFEGQSLLLQGVEETREQEKIIFAIQELLSQAKDLFSRVKTVRNAGLVANGYLFEAEAYYAVGNKVAAGLALDELHGQRDLFRLLGEQAADFVHDIGVLRAKVQS